MSFFWAFLYVCAPIIAVVLLAVVLSLIFGDPPTKKYWGPGETWWPEEEDW